MALRIALFGEPNPRGPHETWFELPNPLPEISALALSDETLRPITHLFLTELLVGTGRASRVYPPRLGPSIAGKRALHLAWRARTRYGGEPETREIEGLVEL
jgi:hypothetical protein